MMTDDGVLIRIVNKGVGSGEPGVSANGEVFYMFTTPTFEAPQGKNDWMNRSVFVATLGARKDTKKAVLIRVFRHTKILDSNNTNNSGGVIDVAGSSVFRPPRKFAQWTRAT